VGIDQPHPAGAQPEEIDDERERFAEGAIDVCGAVECFGNLLEDAEIAGCRATRSFTS
jgi:hypothetical protein